MIITVTVKEKSKAARCRNAGLYVERKIKALLFELKEQNPEFVKSAMNAYYGGLDGAKFGEYYVEFQK